MRCSASSVNILSTVRWLLVLLLASLSHRTAAQATVPAVPSAPHLVHYYEGTINGKLSVHLYFFNTDAENMLAATYYYHKEKGEIALQGSPYAKGKLVLMEYADGGGFEMLSGIFTLTPYSDGSLRGTWQAQPATIQEPLLPVLLRPTSGPGPASCPPARLTQQPRRILPTIATGQKPLDAAIAKVLRGELAAIDGDAGTQACEVSYFGHNLLGLHLSSEMVGANVHAYYSSQTLDLCTGQLVYFPSELDVRRQAAFQLEANWRLHQQIEDYIKERGPQSKEPLLSEDDVAGLREQEFALDAEQLAVVDGFVSFPYQVSYELLSDFIAKDYNGRFGPDFTFEELQAYLSPTSSLRRLVLPKPASLIKRPTVRVPSK
ncbi:MAG: hypothetical protein ACRYG7_10365 [Janthinobacterium lividum]